MARPAPEPDSIVTLPWRSTETRSSLTTACRRMGRLGATSPPVSEIVSLLAVGEFSRPSLTRSHPKPAAPPGARRATERRAWNAPLQDDDRCRPEGLRLHPGRLSPTRRRHPRTPDRRAP